MPCAAAVSAQFFEVGNPVLADGADVIGRKLFTFINIAADLADPALLDLAHGGWQGLGLDVGEIVGIGNGGLLGQDLGLGHVGNKQGVCAAVDGLDHFAGEHRIGAAGEVIQTVCAALQTLAAVELVSAAAALETKALKGIDRKSVV